MSLPRPLSAVADINPPAPFVPGCEDQVAFLPMAAVGRDGDGFAVEHRTYAEVAKGYTPFARGDILLAKITPCFENGKLAHIDDLPGGVGFGSTEFHVVRPHEGVNGRFLYHLLRAPRFRVDGVNRMTGSAGQQRVPAQFLRDYPLIVPEHEAEQRRIAAILDKADAIRARRRVALVDAHSLARATFLHLFGDPVTNPMGWTTKPLGDVVPTIDSGWSPVCEGRPAEQDEWGVLKLSAVTSGRFIAAENKALTSEAEPRAAIEVKHGDVLFTRKNTLDLVAATALVRDHPAHLMMSDLIFRLRPDPEHMEGPVLWAQLSHPSLRRKAQKLAGGSAGSMPNISKERLRTLPLIVPHKPVRRRFIEADQRVHDLAEGARTALADADALYASLSGLAFRGEL